MNTSQATGEAFAPADPDHVVVGILADPEAAPAEVAGRLGKDLGDDLSEHVGQYDRWETRVMYARLPGGDNSNVEVLGVAREQLVQEGWDLAICITDVPMHPGGRPLVADVSLSRRAAVLSLPSFGGMHLGRRVRAVVVQVVAELIGRGSDVSEEKTRQPRGRRRINRLPRQFERVEPDNPEIDTRIVASHGYVRLLIGIVRDNRPWRLVFGLTRAMAAAIAISAFYLVSSGVWELGNALGPVRLTVAMLGSFGALVVWLILRHNLWESPRAADLPRERGEVALFNATTVISLMIGVGCMYVVLFALNLLAGALLLTGEVLGSYVGSALGPLVYGKIAWLTSTAAMVAGALGSGFDSEASVREAAYSSRERERRAERRASTDEG